MVQINPFNSADSYGNPTPRRARLQFKRPAPAYKDMTMEEQLLKHYRKAVASFMSGEERENGVRVRDYVKARRLVRKLVPEARGMHVRIEWIALDALSNGGKRIKQIRYSLFEPRRKNAFPDFAQGELYELMRLEEEYLDTTRQLLDGVEAKERKLNLEFRNGVYVERRNILSLFGF